MAKIEINTTKEVARELKGLLQAERRTYCLKRINFDLGQAVAYKADPIEYGKAYKSKKNGKDLVAYLKDGRLQALIFGKDYTESGVIAEPCWDYHGNRNYAFYADHSDELIVVPQAVVLDLKSCLARKRADRRAAKRVEHAPRLYDRLKAFKKAKAAGLTLEALKVEAAEAVRYTFNYLGLKSEAIRKALYACKQCGVRQVSDVIENVVHDLEKALEAETELKDTVDRAAKIKAETGKVSEWVLENAQDQLASAKAELQKSLNDYKAFRAIVEAA